MARIILLPSDKNFSITAKIFQYPSSGQFFLHGSLKVTNSVITEIKPVVNSNVRDISAGAPEDGLEEKNAHSDILPVSLQDCFLLPAFIDAHVHLALNARSFKNAREEWESGRLHDYLQERLTSYFNCGIAAIRDGGDSVRAGLDGRCMTQKGFHGPRVAACGPPLYRQGRYGAFLGRPLAGQQEVTGVLTELVKEGIDQLKIMASGLVSIKKFGQVGPVQWTLEELKSMVDMARFYGLKVMAHASSSEAVEIAVKAGVHSIEHGYFITRQDLELMAEKDTFWVPTLAPMANLVEANFNTPISQEQRDIISATYHKHMENIARAFEMGVRVAVGTDAGAPEVNHGISFYQELSYYLQCGIAPERVLYAATAIGAEVLGWPDGGSLEPGKMVHILAYPENPLKNPAILQNPSYILVPE